MAEIDQLSIQIEADASNAERAIDGLIGSLQSLASFGSKNSGISSIAKSIERIADAANRVKGISGLGDMGNQASKAGEMIKTFTDELETLYSVTNKGALKEITKHFQNIYDLGKNLGENSALIDREIEDIEKLALEFQRFQNATGKSFDEYSKLRDYINHSTIKIPEGMGKLEEYISDLATIGVRNTSKTKGTPIDAFAQELIAEFPYLEDKLGKAAQDIFHNLAEILSGAKEQGQYSDFDSVLFGHIEEDMRESIRKYSDSLLELRKVNDAANKEISENNGLQIIVENLSALQGITLPDFSGLTALAKGLNELGKVKTERISGIGAILHEIADGVSAMHGMTIPDFSGLNGLADAARNLSSVPTDKIAEAINALNSMDPKTVGNGITQSAAQVSNAMTTITQDVSNMVSGVEQGFEIILREVTALRARIKETFSGDVISSWVPAIRNIGRTIGIELQPIDVEFREIFEVIRREVTALSTEIKEKLSGDVIGNWVPAVSNIGKTIGIGLQPIDVEFREIEEVARLTSSDVSDKMLPAVIGVKDIAEQIASAFRRSYADSVMMHDAIKDMFAGLNNGSSNLPTLFTGDKLFNSANFKEQAQEFRTAAENIIQTEDELRQLDPHSVADGDLREATEDMRTFSEQMREVGDSANSAGEKADEAGKKADNAAKKAKGNSLDLIARLVVLSNNFEKFASQLDRVANVGIKGLKLAFKPMGAVINEYREKINGIADAFRRFSDNAKKQLDKLSAFWKRSMKTFTFMLVRKAITAVITEVNDAVKSLALWSKEYGTVFNDSMSQITSNLSYMARSIVGAFEPLINFAVPAVNALADAVANAAAKLGEFFAAMTGQDYYMKAVRQVTDYGDSVEKANKAQKNLISGLDDLNIITTPTSTAAGMDDLAAQWEKVNVSGNMKDWANAIKSGAKKLFEPIKKAWGRVGDYVVDSFKYMTEQCSILFRDMADDFFAVWSQENTVQIFENLFKTIGHIETAVGNLARNFDSAWKEGGKGQRIFENLRDIVLIVSGHIESMANSLKDWSAGIDFNPLLSAVENFTKKVQPLIDFLGDIVEDIWENIILKYHKWFIEEGAPHFLNTISNIINAFDFEKVKKDLEPVISAIETMMENIHTGITNAIGNIGEAVAEFANSEDFTKFCETVAWILSQVTAERVEKLFTALGDAILKVAGALIKFVGSDKFKNFLDALVNWYDSKDPEEIANGIIAIASAIGTIKLMKFVGEGMSGFITFITIIKAFGKGGELAEAGGGIKEVANALDVLALTLGNIAGFVADIKAMTEFLQILSEYNRNRELPTTANDANGATREASGFLGMLIDVQNKLREFQGKDPISKDIVVRSDLKKLEDMKTGLVTMRNNMWTLGQDTQEVDDIINSSLQMWTDNGKSFNGMTEEQIGVWNNNYKAVEAYYKEVQKTGDPEKALKKLQGEFGGLLNNAPTQQQWASMFEPLPKESEKAKATIEDFSVSMQESYGEPIDWASMVNVYTLDRETGLATSNIDDLQKKLDDAKVESPLVDWVSTVDNQDLTSEASKATDTVSKLPSDMENGVNTKKPSLLTTFSNLGKDMTKNFTDAGITSEQYKKIGSGTISGFDSGVTGKKSAAVNNMSSLARSVNSSFSNEASASKFRGFAQNVVTGFVNGINAFKNNVVGPMQDLARKAWESFKDWLGISSPSKAFSKLGYWTVEGFNEGIEKNEKSSQDIVKDWVNGISKINVPQFDISSAIPKSSLSSDIFEHTDLSGTVKLDSADISADVRTAFTEAIGGLVLPYLNRIEENSRITANKEFGITENQVGQAARNYAQSYQRRTGRPAYGY